MADITFDPVRRVTYVASMSGPYASSWDDPLNFTSLRTGFPAPSAPSHTAAIQKVLVDATVADGSRLLTFGAVEGAPPRKPEVIRAWRADGVRRWWAAPLSSRGLPETTRLLGEPIRTLTSLRVIGNAYERGMRRPIRNAVDGVIGRRV